MKKLVLAALAAIALCGSAHAVPVLLGSVSHDYGLNQHNPAGNDALGNDFVTVSDGSSQRFSDTFDFNGLFSGAISHFELTLSFSQTYTSAGFLPAWLAENWHVRPGNSGNFFEMARISGLASQSFVIDAGTDTFASSAANGIFNLWFSEFTLGGDSFRLYDARLDVYGEPAAVPEPAMLSLLGLSVLGLAVARRKH